MSYNVTRVTVKDNPPPRRPVMSIGRIYPIVEKTDESDIVFRTVRREDDEKSFEDEAETKVVRARRGRRPKANEDAETK